MVLGPAPVLMRWPVFLLPGLLLPQGRDEGEVGHNQQSQMCRWPEVLLLVGECSEEPVVILYAKKTELLSSAAKCVQRQCTCTCCYVASCTEDLRTTEHYGSYVLIFQDKTCSSYSLETVRRRPREVATVTRTLKLTQELKWGGGDREEQDQLHREEALLNFRTSGLWEELGRRTSWIFAWMNYKGSCNFVTIQVEQSCRG